MCLKGRSPNLRHISRTHRVDLDWLIERIKVDPGIRMKYVGTNQQLADMLTKASFTVQKWLEMLKLHQIGEFPCQKKNQGSVVLAQCETAFLCSTARLDRIPHCLLAAAAMASSSDMAPPLPPGPPPGTTQGLPLEEVMPMGAVLSVEELPDWEDDTDESEDSCQENVVKDYTSPLVQKEVNYRTSSRSSR